MPKNKGPGWEFVDLVQEKPPRVQCTLCEHEFPGTGSRIADHLAGIGNQVKHCTGEVPEDVIKQITDQREASEKKKRLRDAHEEIEDPVKRRKSSGSTAGSSGGNRSGASSCGKVGCCAVQLPHHGPTMEHVAFQQHHIRVSITAGTAAVLWQMCRTRSLLLPPARGRSARLFSAATTHSVTSC